MIIVIVGACTFWSPCQEFRYLSWGGPYVLLALLLALDLRGVVPHAKTLLVLNVILIVGGLLSHFRPDLVQALLVDHYSDFSPGLIEHMLQGRKPVLSFATHSLAGFFYGLLFYLNWQTWERRGKVVYIGFSLCYLVLALMLQSVSGYSVVLISVILILNTLIIRRKVLGIVAIGSCLIGLVPVLEGVREDLIGGVYRTASSKTNGILGRYTGDGPGVVNLNYLSEHPLRPIGVGYSRELSIIGDSGLIEHLVRGSLPLVLCVYGGFWYFLWRNVYWKRSRIVLFTVFIAFELGFSNLLYFRTLYFLPFAVAYLNSLESTRHERNHSWRARAQGVNTPVWVRSVSR
jgi:hypothetical protein